MDISFVGVAVLGELTRKTTAKARIALEAVAPTHIRVPRANHLTTELALEAAQIATES